MHDVADPQQYLDPHVLARVRNLELEARLLVEGYLSGMHKSPYHGFSVEFAQHREYVPGDDTRHVDWKVYARTGRFYLKQYEEETNLICWLLLDISESMRYGSTTAGTGTDADSRGGVVSKYDYACMSAAGLAYLVLNQQDSVAFAAFDDHVRHFLRPSSQPSHLKEIVHMMTRAERREKTRLGPIFHDLAERLGRRAVVAVFSDLLDEPDDIMNGLLHLRHAGHDVIVFHVLDPAELEFPFKEATLFRGLEQNSELLTDPRSLRQGYLDQLQGFLDRIQAGCRHVNIDYTLLRTDAPLGGALTGYLSYRSARTK
jgi:uncharacterized protein (DUF58 family)